MPPGLGDGRSAETVAQHIDCKHFPMVIMLDEENQNAIRSELL